MDAASDFVFICIFSAMKIFALLFSIYVLCISVMPCADNEDGEILSEQAAGYVADTHHSGHEADPEHCPPFCACTCCGQVFGTGFLQGTISFALPVAQQHFTAYTSSFVSEVYFNIWQPPKIS